jgi:hypothetical protein
MKIALFTETFLPKIDGIVTRLIHTVDHLQRAGEQVLIFSPDYGIKEYKGARVYGVEGLPFAHVPGTENGTSFSGCRSPITAV